MTMNNEREIERGLIKKEFGQKLAQSDRRYDQVQQLSQQKFKTKPIRKELQKVYTNIA